MTEIMSDYKIADVFCDKCGKNMTGKNGSFIGASIQVLSGKNDKDFVQYQLGKYEVGKVYSFCFESSLRLS